MHNYYKQAIFRFSFNLNILSFMRWYILILDILSLDIRKLSTLMKNFG